LKYELIEDNSASPSLVYDGGEPKRIMYEFTGPGNTKCVFDLWADADSSIKESLPEDQLKEIEALLMFPRKTLLEKEEMVAPIEDGPVYFARAKDMQKCPILVFTLFEKQPSRYQCYILAVLRQLF
jgi:hypothetical protein